MPTPRPSVRPSVRLSVGPLVASLAFVAASASVRATPRAPEQLPPVNVTWEDREQREVFVVRGARYELRVATSPARIASLRVDGVDVLGKEGVALAIDDERGRRLTPAPRDVTPDWSVWVGQGYRRASNATARMNVWSATPYYADAHLLDIPFLTDEGIAALRGAGDDAKVTKAWSFAAGDAGWTAAQALTLARDGRRALLTITGADPQFVSPADLAIALPATVTVRLRTPNAGDAVLYYATDAEGGGGFGDARRVAAAVENADAGQDVRFTIPGPGKLTRLRLDPPGSAGQVRLDAIEVRPARPLPASATPLRGELVLHAHPDRVHLELKVAPTKDQPKPARGVLSVAQPGRAMKVGDRAVATWGKGAHAFALLAPAGGRFDVGATTTADAPSVAGPSIGAVPASTWVLRPAAADADLSTTFAPELKPIAVDALAARGGRWLGYDAASGLYVAETAREGAAYGFDAAHRVPNRRMELPVEIANDAPTARPITVKVRTGAPTLPGAVIADAHGFPTGISAFVAENFAGEREEPDDAGYGDVYFPLTLAANETRALNVVGLFERFGDHLVKQVSSVRFFNVYWHLSTGLSESTCFTHAWMRLNNVFVRIPDFRPRSGVYWLGQPQHDCDTWPGFLQYKSGGQDVRLMYEGTTFRSVAPNLADFTMRFRTSDAAATGTVRAVEVPQADEMRTFVTVRYDWTRAAKIDADARANFRWLNVNEKSRPASVVWLDAAERPQRADALTNEPTLLGEALTARGAFVGTTGKANGYDSLVLVRSFKARLGGRAHDAPHAGAAFGAAGGNYWLGGPAQTLELVPGDFVEAELMLMPHAAPTPALSKPAAERERWFAKPPAVTGVAVGTPAGDFPARVDAEADAARFTIAGGHDAVPVTVGNVRGGSGDSGDRGARPPVPLLWRDDVWVDVQAHGGDGWQTDADDIAQDGVAQDGVAPTWRFTFVVPHRSGQTQQLTVTRVASSEPVTRLADANGRPTLTAAREADFDLAAPILFGPGANRVFAGQPLVSFKGRATSVSGLPIRATVADGEATVTVAEYGVDRASLTKSGAAVTLRVGELSDAVAYELKVNDAVTTPAVRDGSIELKLPDGEQSVELRRAAGTPAR